MPLYGQSLREYFLPYHIADLYVVVLPSCSAIDISDSSDVALNDQSHLMGVTAGLKVNVDLRRLVPALVLPVQIIAA